MKYCKKEIQKMSESKKTMNVYRLLIIPLIVSVLLCMINFARAEGDGPIDNEVIIFDVSDRAFSVLWQVDKPSTCDLKIYNSQNQLLDESLYSKYIDNEHIGTLGQSAAEEHGVMVVTIYNLPKDPMTTTNYFIRTVTKPKSGGIEVIYPSGNSAAISVQTMVAPPISQQPIASNSVRLLEVKDENNQPAEGAIALISVEGSSNPVSSYRPENVKYSWVGGIGEPGLVVLDLMRIFDSSDNKSYITLDGSEDATITVYGGGDRDKWVKTIDDFASESKKDSTGYLLINPTSANPSSIALTTKTQEIPPGVEAITLSFKTGYNLFSIPPFELLYDDNFNPIQYVDAKMVLDKAGVDSEIYKWIDENQQWGNSCKYDLRDVDNFNLEIGKGYFLYAPNEVEYTVRGNYGIYQSTSISLDFYAGYNLVSPYIPQNSLSSLDILIDMNDDQIQIYKFDKDSQSWVSGELGFNIEIGEGYFIYTPSTFTWPNP